MKFEVTIAKRTLHKIEVSAKDEDTANEKALKMFEDKPEKFENLDFETDIQIEETTES